LIYYLEEIWISPPFSLYRTYSDPRIGRITMNGDPVPGLAEKFRLFRKYPHLTEDELERIKKYLPKEAKG